MSRATEKNAGGRQHARPGAALKRLRQQRGLTLAEVAGRVGLPVSSLSKMENDKAAITFGKLMDLSEALDVDIVELIGAAPPPVSKVDGATRRSITRAGDGQAIETDRGNYLYPAAELLYKKFVPIVGDVFAKNIDLYGEYSSHEGDEYVYVLEGTLALHFEIYAPAVLEVGDSVYFDSAMKHAYIAVGDEPCRILSICATEDPRFSRGELLFGPSPAREPRTAKARAKRRGPAAAS